MKIYTKKGDEGQTSLIGGTRVLKSHLRIDAYGTVDELNSCLGMVRDLAGKKEHSKIIIEIQDRLFTIGSLLAADPEKSKMKLPEISETDIVFLEKEIDRMDVLLPEMKHFILPGGHQAVSFCHVTRCVCRRAERLVVLLNENQPVDPLILKYLNRLSDYLFILSRMLSKEMNAEESPWLPRM
jgi:cob(I)alamin adenosyltransferase